MHADNWAIKAKRMGYRSRAVFKLEEILDKLHSDKSYKNVLDLGSAPGGWSQYISLIHPKTKIFAIEVHDKLLSENNQTKLKVKSVLENRI